MRHIDAIAYVDGGMPPVVARRVERHLVCCAGCRYAVEQEHRIRLSLQAPVAPTPPAGLHEMLLSVASLGPVSEAAPVSRPSSPAPLPVVAPRTPPLHRSTLRMALLASVTAGASIAASWSLLAPTAPGGPSRPIPSDGPAGSGALLIVQNPVGQSPARPAKPLPMPAGVVGPTTAAVTTPVVGGLLGPTATSATTTVRSATAHVAVRVRSAQLGS